MDVRQEQIGGNEHEPGEKLINAVLELSLARNLAAVMEIVRRAARDLTGADGATFVLRERDCCYYAEENAIAPLWKGRRFPMTACISGWAMMNRQSAVIEDIYADSRIPVDAYRPTFVKSLAMVPIRTQDPVGAIGNYWATPHKATAEEVRLLQALADSTSIALENIQLYNELELRVKERTEQLETANSELEAFSYSVSHDLRTHLNHIDGFGQLLLDHLGESLDETGWRYLQHILSAASRMNQLIEDLLRLSRVSRTELCCEPVDLSRTAIEILKELGENTPSRQVMLDVADHLSVHGDPGLLRVMLENLLSNAWKYTSDTPLPKIEFGCEQAAPDQTVYYIRDNGAGFDMSAVDNLFVPFKRLHSESEFPGTGLGLTIVQRIVQKHGGRIWAESVKGDGATFFFTLA